MIDRELIDKLRRATVDLYWSSESDSTWQVFLWEEEQISPEQLLNKLGFEPDTSIEIWDLDRLFANATKIQDWHEPEDEIEVRRYQKLYKFLKANLSDIKVYRIEEIEIDLYIVGKTEFGKLAGLYTRIIET
ncbi:MAG: nuclease A inhibitor family protein [Xenococcaceae cyanobacterium]